MDEFEARQFFRGGQGRRAKDIFDTGESALLWLAVAALIAVIALIGGI